MIDLQFFIIRADKSARAKVAEVQALVKRLAFEAAIAVEEVSPRRREDILVTARRLLKTQCPCIKPGAKEQYLAELLRQGLSESSIDILCAGDNVFIDTAGREGFDKKPSGKRDAYQQHQKVRQEGNRNAVVAFVEAAFFKRADRPAHTGPFSGSGCCNLNLSG